MSPGVTCKLRIDRLELSDTSALLTLAEIVTSTAPPSGMTAGAQLAAVSQSPLPAIHEAAPAGALKRDVSKHHKINQNALEPRRCGQLNKFLSPHENPRRIGRPKQTVRLDASQITASLRRRSLFLRFYLPRQQIANNL